MSDNTHPDYNTNEEMIGNAQEVRVNLQEEKPVFSEVEASDVDSTMHTTESPERSGIDEMSPVANPQKDTAQPQMFDGGVSQDAQSKSDINPPIEDSVQQEVESHTVKSELLHEFDVENPQSRKSILPDESDVLDSVPQNGIQADENDVPYSTEDSPMMEQTEESSFQVDIEDLADSLQDSQQQPVESEQIVPQEPDAGLSENVSDEDIYSEFQAEKIMAMMNAEDKKSSGKKKSTGSDDSVVDLGSGILSGQAGTGNDELDPFSKDFKLFDDQKDEKKQQVEDEPFRIKDTTVIIMSRMVLYMVLLYILPKITYIDNTTYTASILVVVAALISAIAIRPLEKMDHVFKQYLGVALAIADMGIALILIYMSGSSGNMLMLAFPLITLTNGFSGINFKLAFIAMLSTMLYYSADIAIGDSGIDSFDYRNGFAIQIGVIVWLISWNFVLEWFRGNQGLRYELLKSIENIIDKLPKPIMEKLALLFNMEKLKGIEHNYQLKIEELDENIAKKDKEIAFLKENLQNGGGGEEYAVNEINSMLELENLSLKENNKKLMELNKSLESRVQMLNQELEIANTELERVYSSINHEEETSDNPDETVNQDMMASAEQNDTPVEEPAQQG
ncbi:MAG: hypothetical protein RBU23_10325 [Candidatus Auribacterota bacterium]|jgi:hypothetical protein|nr:hypothetical protein [Candidatus Auribacterota bacterium]